jgi:hypothetical protein
MQNKLLYLSWLPPFSRSDKIEDYLPECKPVQWEEKRIQSLDGTNLSICEGRIPAQKDRNHMESKRKKSIIICYFQGNGGSTPLRLPLLSQVVRTLAHKSKFADSNVEPGFTLVALSYRGYWTSSGRATQSGIERDAQAFLNWVSTYYTSPDTDLQIVLWGHSLGSAVASSVLHKYLTAQGTTQAANDEVLPPISGLIMEAPISSIKDMLNGFLIATSGHFPGIHGALPRPLKISPRGKPGTRKKSKPMTQITSLGPNRHLFLQYSLSRQRMMKSFHRTWQENWKSEVRSLG